MINLEQYIQSSTDQKNNAKLIEFRIAGGEDYPRFLKYLNQLLDMQPNDCWSPDEYDKEYARALFRLLNKATQLQSKDVEEVENLKTRFDDIRSIIVDTSKQLLVQTDI